MTTTLPTTNDLDNLISCARCGKYKFFYVAERKHPTLCLDCAASQRQDDTFHSRKP